jgi:hypothetical protein
MTPPGPAGANPAFLFSTSSNRRSWRVHRRVCPSSTFAPLPFAERILAAADALNLGVDMSDTPDPDPGPKTVVLEDALDFTAAAPLADRLTSCVGEDLVIDASAVQRLGGSCLQVLIAAARS